MLTLLTPAYRKCESEWGGWAERWYVSFGRFRDVTSAYIRETYRYTNEENQDGRKLMCCSRISENFFTSFETDDPFKHLSSPSFCEGQTCITPLYTGDQNS